MEDMSNKMAGMSMNMGMSGPDENLHGMYVPLAEPGMQTAYHLYDPRIQGAQQLYRQYHVGSVPSTTSRMHQPYSGYYTGAGSMAHPQVYAAAPSYNPTTYHSTPYNSVPSPHTPHKVLSATSPEFVPRTPLTAPITAASPLAPALVPQTTAGQKEDFLQKIKSLIKDMPPPVSSRRPFPSGHQGSQGYDPSRDGGRYSAQDYQGYQSPEYQSPTEHSEQPVVLYNNPSYYDSGYAKGDYANLNYNTAYPEIGYLPSPTQTPRTSLVNYTSPGPSPPEHGYYTQQRPPIPGPRSYLSRKDPTGKDIIITSSKITRNIVRIHETHDENGDVHQTYGNEFKEGNYDVVEDIHQMDDATRQDFWACNWVEIVVDFRAEEPSDMITDGESNKALVKSEATVLDMMARLGADLPKYAKTVFVLIRLPTTDASAPAVLNLSSAQEASLEFKLIESLVELLDTFTSLQKLEVILRTASMTARAPLSLEHINYFLPFFDLAFEEWETKWQAPFMSRAELITAWPLTYLDRERHKINMQRWQEKKAKEAKEEKEANAAGKERGAGGGGGKGKGNAVHKGRSLVKNAPTVDGSQALRLARPRD
jgi:hypothetical protein